MDCVMRWSVCCGGECCLAETRSRMRGDISTGSSRKKRSTLVRGLEQTAQNAKAKKAKYSTKNRLVIFYDNYKTLTSDKLWGNSIQIRGKVCCNRGGSGRINDKHFGSGEMQQRKGTIKRSQKKEKETQKQWNSDPALQDQ